MKDQKRVGFEKLTGHAQIPLWHVNRVFAAGCNGECTAADGKEFASDWRLFHCQDQNDLEMPRPDD
jgi:hypothetical protein